ncbi:MAG TPA: carboxypeptidase-like regulatory domain-containing protein [Prolixibacteraceae bacterium]|nr:carboxypeptidase-like regulatory domain-containing protein [Prolixibacteraceae bacterium]HRV88275.1 carboxypeptidase-like regulatory domain-containing protein [Prolixibacteraceae bacterium]
MKKLVIALQLLFFALVVFAGNDKGVENKKESVHAEANATAMVITGKVVDQVTGEALTGVKVAIEGSDIKVYTDFDGVFRFENVKPGEYDLTATFVSYNRNEVQKFNPVKDGTHLEIKMHSTL